MNPVSASSGSPCGCSCPCHLLASKPGYPGPCAGCCEPGDMCICGTALEKAGLQRVSEATAHTRPGYEREEPG